MISHWFRLWFRFDEPVNRRDYIISGLVLGVIKYIGIVAIAWPELGHIWLPNDYLGSLHSLGVSGQVNGTAPHSMAFLVLLGVWTLPFLWIGVSMSLRRAIDAGSSPLIALLFLVPILNYVMILGLCVIPSTPTAKRPSTDIEVGGQSIPRGLIAIAVGVATGLAMVGLSVYTLKSYGTALFFGTPFAVGVQTAYVLNRNARVSSGTTFTVVAITLAVIGASALLVAIEGILCLAMAAPLALILGGMGAAFGRAMATWDDGPAYSAVLAGFMVPASMLLGPAEPAMVLREVQSAVVINASPEVVWRNVIAFPPLAAPNEFVFRAGIAYPIRAEIVGSGVGAERHCVFSTGAFVEPITVWEPGRRLSFDVTAQPRPMQEWSPYADVAPPHLDGYFTSKRGEFRLVRLPDGKTRLEGSTWYEMKLYPAGYWSLYGDLLIHKIHLRVLDHIRVLAEREAK